MSMRSSAGEATAPPVWVWPVAVLIGAFLVNAIPHGMMGITGQAFPTPFSGGPPNLSPAWLNVAWALVNLAVGYALLRLIVRWRRLRAVKAVIAVAGALAALGLAVVFTGVVGAPP